jgi:hypothetical protein
MNIDISRISLIAGPNQPKYFPTPNMHETKVAVIKTSKINFSSFFETGSVVPRMTVMATKGIKLKILLVPSSTFSVQVIPKRYNTKIETGSNTLFLL